MRYIRKVKLEYPGTKNEHIVEVQYSTSPYGTLFRRSRALVVQDIDGGIEPYTSHNDSTGDQARVSTRQGAHYRYIATVADGRETNNLLALPRYQ